MYNNIARSLYAFAFALALVVASSLPAFAAPIVDFTDSSWAGANGQSTYSTGGVTATANPILSLLSQNSSGMGVYSVVEADSEIGLIEVLDLAFGSGFMLNGFTVSKLYREPGILGMINEVGYYSINGGSWLMFQAPNSNTPGGPGELAVSFALQNITSLRFGVDNPFGSLRNFQSNFSVKDLQGVPATVPEPGSMLLLGTGLIGLASKVRKRWPPRTKKSAAPAV